MGGDANFMQVVCDCGHQVHEAGQCTHFQCYCKKHWPTPQLWAVDHNPAPTFLTDNFDMSKGGIKLDEGKLRYDLFPPHALATLVQVYTMGAKKYDDFNWARGMRWGRVFAAAMRHAWAWARGEDLDPESGLPHLAHAAWSLITLLEFGRMKVGTDDRFKS